MTQRFLIWKTGYRVVSLTRKQTIGRGTGVGGRENEFFVFGNPCLACCLVFLTCGAYFHSADLKSNATCLESSFSISWQVIFSQLQLHHCILHCDAGLELCKLHLFCQPTSLLDSTIGCIRLQGALQAEGGKNRLVFLPVYFCCCHCCPGNSNWF